jgi:tetraacyldisaccharide 4'-kinase
MKQSASARPLLAPLVPLYRIALLLRELGLRFRLEPLRRLRFPVLSIGNLSTGGAGKTPLAIAIAQALTRRGLRVDVLSRGYGRKSRIPARVDPNGSAAEFGDEPLVIARETGVPVYVAAERYLAGLLAESAHPAHAPLAEPCYSAEVLKGHGFSRAVNEPKEQGALAPEGSLSGNLHLLDDGFQHRQLHRDFDILLLDRRDWRDRLLPAGNLREPLSAIQRADVVAIPADDPEAEPALRALGWQGPIWRLRRRMEIPPISGPVVAFCGIARPAQFFDGLEAAGLRLAARIAFRDHHRYTARDFDRLQTAARASGASALITTEKDLVRLPTFPASLPLKTARLHIEIDREDEIIDWLLDRFS